MNEEFKQELKALLAKYNASICAETSGEGYSTEVSLAVYVGDVPVFETVEHAPPMVTHYDL